MGDRPWQLTQMSLRWCVRPDPSWSAANIGARQLQAWFVSRLREILDKATLRWILSIRIERKPALTRPEVAQDCCLPRHGRQVCPDDLVTGYSSLTYLSTCSGSDWKIDQSFQA